jgi:hypothetical protein
MVLADAISPSAVRAAIMNPMVDRAIIAVLIFNSGCLSQ